jgi:hypothetical protein
VICLAAPSTPASAIAEIARRVEASEPPTVAEIAACFTSADTERPRRRRHRPILSSGDGFANLFDRRIQKGLSEVGVVDDAR